MAVLPTTPKARRGNAHPWCIKRSGVNIVLESIGLYQHSSVTERFNNPPRSAAITSDRKTMLKLSREPYRIQYGFSNTYHAIRHDRMCARFMWFHSGEGQSSTYNTTSVREGYGCVEQG